MDFCWSCLEIPWEHANKLTSVDNCMTKAKHKWIFFWSCLEAPWQHPNNPILVGRCMNMACGLVGLPGFSLSLSLSLSLSVSLSLSLLSLSSPASWPFTPRSLITSQQIKILTWNFQDMLLWVREHHSGHREWSYHPCLLSGTLNVLQVHPFLTHFPLRHQHEIFRVSSFG